MFAGICQLKNVPVFYMKWNNYSYLQRQKYWTKILNYRCWNTFFSNIYWRSGLFKQELVALCHKGAAQARYELYGQLTVQLCGGERWTCHRAYSLYCRNLISLYLASVYSHLKDLNPIFHSLSLFFFISILAGMIEWVGVCCWEGCVHSVAAF